MSILFRFLATLIAGVFRPKLGLDGTSLIITRVWPIDLDINVHMNNARYLAVMDLGRIDFIIRTGAWRLMHKEGMAPVVGGCMVRYRRSLRPFERFELRTRLLGWDERWLYFEQSMRGRDGIACVAVQRGGFTRSGRLVTPAELTKKLNYIGPNIAPPTWVAGWHDSEAAFYKDSEMFLSSAPAAR
jgi:acyl-CoA thioesterase FadM